MEELLKQLHALREDVDFEHETGLIDNRLLDSFDVIQIIAMLDEKYDITVPASQIIPANFNSATAIYELIQRLSDE